jgi:hypothetical protein
MTCTHTRDTSRWIDEFENDWGYVEPGHWEYDSVSTTEDIDLHRYRCTQCGLVQYYSGRAREHFEEGKTFDWIQGLR